MTVKKSRKLFIILKILTWIGSLIAIGLLLFAIYGVLI